ncbi:MAG: hypothetical protein DRR19_02235 [Candidatus Parabeggiatoa sp. nov. 1]|nr:MAG: hypothetical protein DRR19_02235 [Gammaproteobacteria bacterium]
MGLGEKTQSDRFVIRFKRTLYEKPRLILRSTRRTLYEIGRYLSGVQGEPCTKLYETGRYLSGVQGEPCTQLFTNGLYDYLTVERDTAVYLVQGSPCTPENKSIAVFRTRFALYS